MKLPPPPRKLTAKQQAYIDHHVPKNSLTRLLLYGVFTVFFITGMTLLTIYPMFEKTVLLTLGVTFICLGGLGIGGLTLLIRWLSDGKQEKRAVYRRLIQEGKEVEAKVIKKEQVSCPGTAYHIELESKNGNLELKIHDRSVAAFYPEGETISILMHQKTPGLILPARMLADDPQDAGPTPKNPVST